MATYHGNLQQYQASVDFPERGEQPENVLCFRYHRMCPHCRKHQLDDLMDEFPTGRHSGLLHCTNCESFCGPCNTVHATVLPWFYVWDCTAKQVIARAYHGIDPDDSPAVWSAAWLQSVKHLLEE